MLSLPPSALPHPVGSALETAGSQDHHPAAVQRRALIGAMVLAVVQVAQAVPQGGLVAAEALLQEEL